MKHNFEEIRQEEAFYHSNHYQIHNIESQDSWLGYPVANLVELGLTIANANGFSSFLDLGCGVGRNSIPIVQTARSTDLKIDCVDILPIAIQKFSQYARKNNLMDSFNFYVSDISQFNLSNKAYDFIFSVSTLEHLKNKKQLVTVLKTIKNATKDMGYIYFVINSEVTEFLVSQQKEISPFIEINLSSADMISILTGVFRDWTLINTEIKNLSFQIERSIGNTRMTTDAITFIAQKKPPL